MLTRARRIAVLSFLLIVAAALLAPPAGGATPATAPPGGATLTSASVAGSAVLAQQSDGSGGAPSIIPDPNERGTNNIGGLLVGTVLLGGWIAVGTVMLVRARRRRATIALPGT